jgi:hypothetical protein
VKKAKLGVILEPRHPELPAVGAKNLRVAALCSNVVSLL